MTEPTRDRPERSLEELASDVEFLYTDDHIAVIQKPSGMLVHRGWDRDRIVAMTVVRDRLSQYVYPIHRLDRPTSGVVLFALHQDAARALQKDFEQRRVQKRYIALVRGITPESGTIDSPVPKTPKGERVDAVTEFERMATFERFSLVQARPKTGRLHQIRRHLRHIGHPLIGDVNYGVGEHNRRFRQDFNLWRLALHASEIGFNHPHTQEPMCIQARVPDDLAIPLIAMGIDEEIFQPPRVEQPV